MNREFSIIFPVNCADYFNEAFTSKNSGNSNKSDEICYYKLPHISKFSTTAQSRVQSLTKKFCKELKIKLVFSIYKINYYMLNNVKDTIPRELKSYLEYKFTCAKCNSCYVGETGQHFGIRVQSR